MLIKTLNNGFIHPASSEITTERLYRERRTLIKLMASGAAGAAMASWASREAMAQELARPGKNPALPGRKSPVAGAVTMDKLTDYKDASGYNNFYEFGTDKADPAKNAGSLVTNPWTVEVEGLVKKPAKYAIEDLLKLSAQEERIYRLRCVEGWSMVIPWVGYSVAELIKKSGTPGQRQVRRVHHPGGPQDHAFCGLARARMALHRSAAHGRSHAPAGHAGLRYVRRDNAQAKRCTAAPGGALEIRLQERQEHCQNPLYGQRTQDLLEQVSAAGIRFLFQRQPDRRPPALEPGQRKAHR